MYISAEYNIFTLVNRHLCTYMKYNIRISAFRELQHVIIIHTYIQSVVIIYALIVLCLVLVLVERAHLL